MTTADVLVIDDDRGTLETFAFILRSVNVPVRIAETATDGLQHARQRQPGLVLCDLNLPDGTALDVLGGLRRFAIDVPFIVITGFGHVSSAVEAGRLGAVDYLEKPITEEQLLDLVATHTRPDSEPTKKSDVRERTSHADKAKRVIEQRYSEPDLSVSAVALALGISAQHVCRVLKREFGITFADLLRNVRLREARRLLREPSWSMKEIAFRVGFRHASQFTHIFRMDCGLSPSQYRDRPTKVKERHH